MGFARDANIHPPFSGGSSTEAGIAAITREDEQLRSAANELAHRLKNRVAVIQSITRQTTRQSATMDDFEARFASCLGAFGRAVDLLVADDRHGGCTNEIVPPARRQEGARRLCRSEQVRKGAPIYTPGKMKWIRACQPVKR